MTNKILAASLALGALSAPAFSQSGNGECSLQADIVMQVVTAREEGDDAEAAQLAIAQGLTGEAEKYVSVVPAIAEWVYALPADQLGPEVGESWKTQCENL